MTHLQQSTGVTAEATRDHASAHGSRRPRVDVGVGAGATPSGRHVFTPFGTTMRACLAMETCCPRANPLRTSPCPPPRTRVCPCRTCGADAIPLGISVDGVWCHRAFADRSGVAERALYVIDPDGVLFWSYLSPRGINPGADGILNALEAMSAQRQGAQMQPVPTAQGRSTPDMNQEAAMRRQANRPDSDR